MTQPAAFIEANRRMRELIMEVLEEEGPMTSFQLRPRLRLRGAELNPNRIAQLLRYLCVSAQIAKVGEVSGYHCNPTPVYALPVSLASIVYDRAWQDELAHSSTVARDALNAHRREQYVSAVKTDGIALDREDLEWATRIAARNALKHQMRSRV
ncbi:MAG TPA: hypothetical protein DCS21_05215 [Gammaproteobacteria bacterium]|nr:hypothetical protein [Gammaproteobacteria bacterium]